MWQPNNKYRTKTTWADHEDKALLMSWGLTDIHEIAEAFMCHPIDIIDRAKQIGIMPISHEMLTAQHIERIVQLFEAGAEVKDVTDIFGLPDSTSIYQTVPSGSIPASEREIQDYYAKRNEHQMDIFGSYLGPSDNKENN